MILSIIVLLSACEQGFPSRDLGDGFTNTFLQSGDQVPLDSRLQVYIGDRIHPADYPAVSAGLELGDGTPVPGDFAINEGMRVLVFYPDDLLPPGQTLRLTITCGTDTFFVDFTTDPRGRGLPPVVVIDSPADGSGVSGMVEVLATVTDDTFILGRVWAAVDGVDFGWRLYTPPHFYLNTANLSDGPHTITVRATDGDYLQGSGSITVTVNNPAPNGVGFPITTEGLDPEAGVAPSAALAASLSGGVKLTIRALTDANYSSWATTGLEVGNLVGTTYTATETFGSAGVVCINFTNYQMTDFNLPASALTLTLPDHSVHVISLPATTVNAFSIADGLRQVAFYVSIDGQVHWAHAAAGQVSASAPPDLSPSAALALPSP